MAGNQNKLKSIREMTSGIVKDVKYAKPWLIIAITLLLAMPYSAVALPKPYRSAYGHSHSVICGVGVYGNAVYNKRSERAVCEA